jgi:hypothetical protein
MRYSPNMRYILYDPIYNYEIGYRDAQMEESPEYERVSINDERIERANALGLGSIANQRLAIRKKGVRQEYRLELLEEMAQPRKPAGPRPPRPHEQDRQRRLDRDRTQAIAAENRKWEKEWRQEQARAGKQRHETARHQREQEIQHAAQRLAETKANRKAREQVRVRQSTAISLEDRLAHWKRADERQERHNRHKEEEPTHTTWLSRLSSIAGIGRLHVYDDPYM